MKLQRFEVSNTPHLTIECLGDLDISGGREGEVAIKAYGYQEDLDVQREGEHFTLTARVRCKIGCPQGTTLTLQSVHGNLRLRQVDGPIAAENVHGDVVLKDVGPTTITSAAGDVRVRSVRGGLRLDQVGGDLLARGVEGGLRATAGGDGVLTTDFTPGCDYQLTTGGDAVVKFPDRANARIQANAGGEIRHKVAWAELQENARTLSGHIGEGGANLMINAGGHVSLRGTSDSRAFVLGISVGDDLDVELESMAEELERSIEAHMARMNAQLEAQLSRIDHEAIRLKAERAAEKVRRKAERAAERARLKAERAQRRWERMSAQRPDRHVHRAAVHRRTASTLTDKERLMVLRMVQEGKITADEAARLLEAMEG